VARMRERGTQTQSPICTHWKVTLMLLQKNKVAWALSIEYKHGVYSELTSWLVYSEIQKCPTSGDFAIQWERRGHIRFKKMGEN